MLLFRLLLLVLLLPVLSGCSAITSTAAALGSNIDALFRTPRSLPSRLTDPYLPGARLSVLWIGHATMLIQMDDRFILTDPNLNNTVGQFSKRLVEPGMAPEHLPVLDAVLVSHMHIDHLSLSSLDMIADRTKQLIVPRKGLVYIPDFDMPMRELGAWQVHEQEGLRITALPVRHNGWRYAADSWMDSSYTSYLLEYNGLRVYFGGDTGYDSTLFHEIGERYPGIHTAILPIAPIHPREYSAGRHTDPVDALRIANEVGAAVMIPMHFETFSESLDRPGEARQLMDSLSHSTAGSGADVRLMNIGERVVLIPSEEARLP